MSKYITTHEELLKLDGRHVRCVIKNCNIEDGIISVCDDSVWICQNHKDGLPCDNKHGKKYSWLISNGRSDVYENNNRNCIYIELIDESEQNKNDCVEEIFVHEPAVVLEAQKSWDSFMNILLEVIGRNKKTIKDVECLTKKLKEILNETR